MKLALPILFVTIFAHISLISQSFDQYFQFTNSVRGNTYPEGGFDQNGNLIVCADDESRQRILVLKFDTSQQLIDSVYIPCANNGCSLNNAVVTENGVFAVIQERITWDKRELRILVLDSDFNVVKDSIFLPYKWENQYSKSVIEGNEETVVVSAIVAGSSADTTTGTAFFLFSKNGSLLKDTVLRGHFGSKISKLGSKKYLLALGSYTIFNRKYSDRAAILNSNFEIEDYFRTDSSSKHYINWQTDMQVTYKPTKIYDFTNVFCTRENVFTAVSAFDIDTFDISDPNNRFPVQQVMRVAQTTIDDSLISEHYFISDSSWISAAYSNYYLLPDSSFLVLGVSNVSQYYEPLTPLRSSYILAKFTKDARLVWSKNYSLRNYYYHGTQITVSPFGSIAIIGTAFDYSGSGMNYGNVLFLDSNGVFEKEVGVNQFESSTVTMSIYPNPVSGFFSIDFITEANGQFNVMNTSGQLVLQKSIVQGQNEIDASELTPGMYFYQIIDDNQVALQNGKLVKD